MRFYTLHKLAFFVILIVACNTHKKIPASSAVTDEPAIQLDTINVLAKEPMKREIYKESNPKENDIIHTKLEVNFDWKQSRMNGKATILIKPYFYATNKLYLNAKGMEIKKLDVFEMGSINENKTPNQLVELGNRLTSSSYTYENDSLKINLGRNFSAEEHYVVVIDYISKPNELRSKGGSSAITDDKGLYFVNPTGENPFKMPQIWTQGETQANSVWFPTIDSPNEKMTQEILMTVEDKYTTLSNGTLINSVKQVDGSRTDHWRLDQPHAPYLAMMAVGEFKKVTDKPWKDKEISYYVEKDYETHARGIFGDTGEMIEFFSTRLGVPYAWPKYAQIIARDYVSGAMENTSATLHGDFVYQTTRDMIDGKKGEDVISHELFHQWFGDLVTCESWSNLPLNESFATYGEYLWNEYKFGRDAADYRHNISRQGYMYSTKEVDVIRFNYNDKEDMFDAFSYNKGGQILHMLRKAVGDEAFFASLKNYLETNKYKSVEIHDLRLAFEETTGRDMNWFFNQWFLNKGRPKLKVSQSYKGNAGQEGIVTLTVEQTQDLKNTPLYRLPLEVDLYMNGKTERRHITITEQKQIFSLAVEAETQLVNFDAERQLLADLDYPKTLREYLFQYKNAPLCGDRLEALKELESKMAEEAVYNLFKEAAQNDKFYSIRNYAIQKLEKVSSERIQDLKGHLITIYATDKNTVTRAKALGALNRIMPGTAEVTQFNENALKEESYAICAEALDGLSKSKPQLALEKALFFENESGKDLLFTIANLYASHGGDTQIYFFHKALKYISGYELMSFCSSYSKTALRCKDPANAISAATDLESIGKGANKYVKFSTVKGIKDILNGWENKEKTTFANLETAKKGNSSSDKGTQSIAQLEKELKAATEAKEYLTALYNRVK